MALKIVMAAIAAAAVAVGLLIPVPHKTEAEPATQSQIETISVGHG